MFELMVEDTFASAHQLIGYEGACENIHGHTWKVQVFVKGEKLNRIGLLFDFKEAKRILKDIIAQLDHKNLNEIKLLEKGQNPTAENLSKMIFGLFGKELPDGVNLSKVTVWESGSTCATYSS